MADDGGPLALIKTGYTKLLESGYFSDLQISCSDGTVYNVHKIVLCSQSAFFMNALNPESNFQEAQTNRVPLEHDEPFAVKALIEYLYRFEYTDVGAPVNELLLFHVHIYAIGETYGVQGLKKLACDRFQAVVEDKTFEKLDLPMAIKVIYTTTVSTDRGLRDKAIEIVRADLNVITELKGFPEMMAECAQFSKDLALSLAEDLNTVSRYHCRNCSAIVPMELPEGRNPVCCPHCGKYSARRYWMERKASDLEYLKQYKCVQCSNVTEMELRLSGLNGSMTWCPSCGAGRENTVWQDNEVSDGDDSDEDDSDEEED
ncbi:hypothetical protein IWX49DRAFT_291936 [Phyllosticta citricarpa]